MKKTAILAGVTLLLAFTQLSAQEEQPVKKNPTVDSITSKYKLMEMPKPLTVDQIFPIVGQYQVTNNTEKTEVGAVKIILDEQNKGTVWIEGLPQGRIYAQLRKSPATYKIPTQKTAEGNDVPEGTLIFDKDTKMVNISIGRPYNILNPDLAFSAETEQPVVAVTEVKTKGTKTKVKTVNKPMVKHLVYSGPKEEQTTVMNN